MDLRELRVFVAAAEEGGFTRAAERLFLTQQAVSSAIRRLERDLGVTLFVRGHRATELTQAGAELLDGARDLLQRADRLSAAVAATDAPPQHRALRIGVFANGASQLNHPILRAFRTRYPDVDVTLVPLGFADHVQAVLDRRVDVAIVRPPVHGDERLDLERILTEPQVAMLSPVHPLADAAELRADDLLDEVFVDAVGAPVWTGHWQLEPQRNGEEARTARIAPVATVPALNEVIALGLAVSTTAASCQTVYPHPAVRYVPVVDAPGSDVAIARHHEAPPLATAFGDVAAEVARELAQLLPGSTAP